MNSGPKIFRSAVTGLLLVLGGLAAQGTAAADTNVQTHQSSDTVKLVVGRSIVMNTQVSLRRIYVGNPLVLISYTASPNEIVITGKAIGTSSLMVWDSNGGSKLYTVEVSTDPSAIEDALKVEYPKEHIQVSVDGDHIALAGNVSTKEVADGALKLAQNYSKQVNSSLQVTGHPREVKLKVRFVEVDRSKTDQFAVDLLSLGLKQTVGQTGTQQSQSSSISTIQSGGTSGNTVTATISNPLNFFVYNLKNNIGASIADLAQQNVLQILAEPTLTSMSGQAASFLSGGEFPFPTIQASAGSTPVVTVSFRPYGIKLDFTPTVNEDGTIRLKVAPEVSSLDYSNAVTISGYSIPALSTRRSQTEVELTSGQSFAISGLLDRQTQEAFARTPGIASIPILGELFKSKNNSHSITELVVIITADLVDPMTAPAPVEPKMSVPNMEADPFDKQINKNKLANPNTNRDTGKTESPVAPQNQATTPAQPVVAANTPAPAAAENPSTPETSTATAAPAPAPAAPTGHATNAGPESAAAEAVDAPVPVQAESQQPGSVSSGPAPTAPAPAETPTDTAAATAPKLRLRMKTANN
jgi:pilus assembly protein CpaC